MSKMGQGYRTRDTGKDREKNAPRCRGGGGGLNAIEKRYLYSGP